MLCAYEPDYKEGKFLMTRETDNTHKETDAALPVDPSLPMPHTKVHNVCAQLLCCIQLFATPLGCNPAGSSVHGILQERILEWDAMPSSRGSSRHRDGTQASCVSLQWQADSLLLSPHQGMFF